MPKRKTRSRNRVAENIYRRRVAKQLTQARLADRVGVSRVTLNRFENAHLFPSAENLDKLALILGCDVQHLFREPYTKG